MISHLVFGWIMCVSRAIYLLDCNKYTCGHLMSGTQTEYYNHNCVALSKHIWMREFKNTFEQFGSCAHRKSSFIGYLIFHIKKSLFKWVHFLLEPTTMNSMLMCSLLSSFSRLYFLLINSLIDYEEVHHRSYFRTRFIRRFNLFALPTVHQVRVH